MSKTKPSLYNILNGSEIPAPSSILITDASSVIGQNLLSSAVCSCLRAGAEVHYLTSSHSKEFINSKYISLGLIKIYDGFCNPGGWEDHRGGVQLEQPLYPLFMNSIIESSTADSLKLKRVIVIDKVEDVLRYQSPEIFLRSIHQLIRDERVLQVISLCGRDVVTEATLSALSYMCEACISLLHTVPVSCKIVLVKSSGKVFKSHEEFTMNKEYQIRDVCLVEHKTLNSMPKKSDEDNVLAAQTTFTLTLTDQQRKTKSNVILPYTRIQLTGGHIHYTPDDVDDWDEDDPDEDLAI